MRKIIVVNNPMLAELYEHAQASERYSVKVLSEIESIEAINARQCDFALISPLVYASLDKNAEYKIIKSSLLAVENYSGCFVLSIANKQKKLTTLYTDTLNEFVIVCAKLVLSERFGIDAKLVNQQQDADMILSSSRDRYHGYTGLDLTEYWFDTFEIPMIAGFWVAGTGLCSYDVLEEIKALVCSTNDLEQIVSIPENDADYEKTGFIHWRWDDRLALSLEKTFDLLYYRGFTNDIADIAWVDTDVSPK